MSDENRGTEGHRFLEHTTDSYIEAWGPSLERAFAQGAQAFYETMLDPKKINSILEENIQVEGHDKKELLYNWIEQLLLEFDIKRMVYSSYDITIASEDLLSFKLRGRVKGEKYDREKHGAKTEIKGVTYHLMTIEEDTKEARVRFILDL